jgi:hypothetical protein
MRLLFNNTDRVKKLAALIEDFCILKHSHLLDVVAKICGYQNFHELQLICVPNESGPPADFSIKTSQRADYVDRLSVGANLSHGDAMHCLESSRLLGCQSAGMKELLAVRTELYSRAYQINALKRGKGEVGKVKSLPSGEAVGILRQFGRPTRVITNKSANTILADFEYTSVRNPLPFFIPMRLYLPYGHWIEKDGSWVLFSRDYFPLWRIRKEKAPERLDPSERIKFTFENHYWGRHRWPWSHPDLYDELIEQLDEHGIRSLPRSVEILKLVLDNDQIDDFSDAIPKYWMKAA